MRIVAFIILTAWCAGAAAQSDKKLVKEGNALFEKGKFADAELKYRKSLEKTKTPFVPAFNLGDALYKQGKYDEAASAFSKIAAGKIDKQDKAQVMHNLGNTLLQKKEYEKSIQAYKEALKAAPTDADTKYNLAYAQAMMQQQQQKQKQDKNKDKNDQNKDKQKQDKNQQKQNKEEQQQQQQPSKIDKQEAERMLEALNNKEKDLQKKNGKKVEGRANIEKDW